VTKRAACSKRRHFEIVYSRAWPHGICKYKFKAMLFHKKTFTLIRIKAGITFFYEEQCQERKYPAMMSRVTE
jgi:hypothetical protein